MPQLFSSRVKRKLILFLIVVLSCSLIFMLLVSGVVLSAFLPKQSTVYFQEVVNRISGQLSAEMVRNVDYAKSITQNYSIRYYLQDMLENPHLERKAKYNIIRGILQLTPKERTYLENVYLYPKSGAVINAYYSRVAPASDEIAADMMRKPGTVGRHIWDDCGGADSCIALYQSIVSSRGECLGVIKIELNKSFISAILSEGGMTKNENKKILIVGEDEQTIFGDISVGDDVVTRAQRHNLIVKKQIPNTGWWVIGMLSPQQITQKVTDYNIWVFSVIFLAFLVITISISLYVGKLLKPLETIMYGMKMVQQGKLVPVRQIPSHDEFDSITDNFNLMVRQVKKLIKGLYRQKELVKDARLAEMTAKFDPHFLYNSLDTIYWMAVVKKQYPIAEVVISLSDILRYSISSSNQFVPLRDDLGMLQKYISIHTVRFAQKIHCELLIPETLRDCKVLKLVLQPLVENAIKHGFGESTEEGMICITARESGEDIEFTVSDNGCGMTAQRLEQIRNGQAPSRGIGVKLVNDRLRFTYGEDSALRIFSIPGKGSRISFKMKKHLPEILVQVVNEDDGASELLDL